MGRARLNWTVPNDGGSPITGYKIRRDGTHLAAVGLTTTHQDSPAPNGAVYEVAAVNSAGTSAYSNVGFFGKGNARAVGFSLPYIDYIKLTQAELDARLIAMAGIGVGWVRFDLPALFIESGTTNARDWTDADRLYNAATNSGLRVLWCVTTIPPRLRTETLAAGTEFRHGALTLAQREGFRDFGLAAIARYPTANAWEVWNEPNYGGFWLPQPISGDLYAQLLAAVYAPWRAALPPGVPIVTGGTAFVSSTPAPDLGGLQTRQWYVDLYGRGIKANCDAIGVHPYPDAPLSRSGDVWREGAQELGWIGGLAAQTPPSVRATMNANGDTAKPIFGTEVGYPTPPGSTSDASEDEQGKWMSTVLSGWTWEETDRGLGTTGPLFVYTFQDRGTDPAVRENHWGFRRSDGTRKPAFSMLRNWLAVVQADLETVPAATATALTNTLAGTIPGRVLLHTLAMDKAHALESSTYATTAAIGSSTASTSGRLAITSCPGGTVTATWDYGALNATAGGHAVLVELDLGAVNLAGIETATGPTAANEQTLYSQSSPLTVSMTAAPTGGWLIGLVGIDTGPANRDRNPLPGDWAEIRTRALFDPPNNGMSLGIKRVASGGERSLTPIWLSETGTALSDQQFVILAFVPDA